MAQVTIYLPDELEKRVRSEAKRKKMSVSAFLAELAGRTLKPSRWPQGFDQLYGSWAGEVPDLEDPPPDEVEPL